MPDGTEPIDDGEMLYRRIHVPEHFDPSMDPRPSPKGFHPNQHDVTGISLDRAKYVTPKQAARGRPGKKYAVVGVRAGDLRAAGMEVVPRPVPGNPGHAEIPELNYENRRRSVQQEWEQLLADKLCTPIAVDPDSTS